MSAADLRTAAAPPPLRVGIVAGEHSGDQLGAALIAALRERAHASQPAAIIFGPATPKHCTSGARWRSAAISAAPS